MLTDGVVPWVPGSGATLGLFGSVLLHELGHSLVARRYGLEIESITLWFLGGLAQFAEFPDGWRQELTGAESMTPLPELDTVTPDTTVGELLDRMVRKRPPATR